MNKIKLNILFFLSFGIANLAIGQIQPKPIVLPTPAIGWDSLQNLLSYPEIGVRAKIEGAYRTTIEIDQNGSISSLKTNCLNVLHNNNSADTLLISWIENKIRSVRWLSGNDEGNEIKLSIEIVSVYYLTKDNSKYFILNRNVIPVQTYKKGCVWPTTN